MSTFGSAQTIINTAGKISIEQVTIFHYKYISEDAVDLKFSPDVNNNPSNPYILIKQTKFRNEFIWFKKLIL